MPQRQKTAPIDARELPELTDQQQEFVRQRLAGKTATDAYKAAYSTENMLPRTIWAQASRMNSHPDIAAWLAAGREAYLGTTILTREGHMAELERLREIALKTGNIGAAVQAEQLRGKVAGHQIDRVADVTTPDATDTLTAIASVDKELAHKLALAHGIPFDMPATKH